MGDCTHKKHIPPKEKRSPPRSSRSRHPIQDSSGTVEAPPVVPQAGEQPNAEVVQDVELPQESQFSEDEAWELVATMGFLTKNGLRLSWWRER